MDTRDRCRILLVILSEFNPFMHNVVKWPWCLHRKILKYVWPFYNIMHERVKRIN